MTIDPEINRIACLLADLGCPPCLAHQEAEEVAEYVCDVTKDCLDYQRRERLETCWRLDYSFDKAKPWQCLGMALEAAEILGIDLDALPPVGSDEWNAIRASKEEDDRHDWNL